MAARCTRIWCVRPVSSLQAQQARAGERLGQLEVRDGGPLGAAADGHAAHVVAVAADGRVDRAAARRRAAAHERDVLALDAARAHLLAERRVGLVAAGQHEQAGGVAVEPVDRRPGAARRRRRAGRGSRSAATSVGPTTPGAGCVTTPAGLSATITCSSISASGISSSAPGSGPAGRRGGLLLELDQLAAGQPQRLVRALAVDAHAAALDQALGGGARGQAGVLGEVAVEALAGRLVRSAISSRPTGTPRSRSPGIAAHEREDQQRRRR